MIERVSMNVTPCLVIKFGSFSTTSNESILRVKFHNLDSIKRQHQAQVKMLLLNCHFKARNF